MIYRTAMNIEDFYDAFEDYAPYHDSVFSDALNQEIKWCIDNPDDDLSKDYQEGFIAGLIQAKYLIRALILQRIDHSAR